jgi:hypothetical protein
MKIAIFWDIAPCSPYMNRRFLLGWFNDPEDGGDTFLRNVGSYTYYTALYSRRWQSLSDKYLHTAAFLNWAPRNPGIPREIVGVGVYIYI